MTSRLSYNVHSTTPGFDKGKLIDHLKKIRPAWVLVMDGLQVCKDIKAAIPECNVIHRAYPDEEIYKTVSPQEWVDRKVAEIGGADVWCYTVNEMGYGDTLVNWFTAVIECAARAHLKVVVGNMSAGTPQPEEWSKPASIALLKALDKNRSNAVMACHEYACGVVTSGFLGGFPNNAGVPANEKGGLNLIPSANWPSVLDAHVFTKFHMGRFYFLLQACQIAKINPPRLVITEHGFDDVSDIKAWADTLPKTPPYTTIRGWQSCQNVWNQWYSSVNGWTPQEAYFQQLKWADQAIYQGTPVEGQLIYCWGHSSKDWEQFDVSQAGTLQTLIEAYAGVAVPMPPVEIPTPTPTPPIITPPEPPQQPPPIAIDGAFCDAQIAGLMIQVNAWIRLKQSLENAAPKAA